MKTEPHDAPLEVDPDVRYDQDVAYVTRLAKTLLDGLDTASLISQDSEEVRVRVRCYARSGLPIEIDLSR